MYTSGIMNFCHNIMHTFGHPVAMASMSHHWQSSNVVKCICCVFKRVAMVLLGLYIHLDPRTPTEFPENYDRNSEGLCNNYLEGGGGVTGENHDEIEGELAVKFYTFGGSKLLFSFPFINWKKNCTRAIRA